MNAGPTPSRAREIPRPGSCLWEKLRESRKINTTNRFAEDRGGFLISSSSLQASPGKPFSSPSAVKCRPPHNRTPHKDELDTCRELWLLKQITIVDPEIVVLMGRTAIRSLLNKEESLERLHGTTMGWEARQFLITYHPAAGMRFPKVGQSMKSRFPEAGFISILKMRVMGLPIHGPGR